MPSTDWFTRPWPKECLQGANKVASLSCIPAMLNNLLSVLITFAGLTALVMFLAGSFKAMNAAGDPKKTQSASNSFKYAIIGLSVIAASFILISIISTVTGVKCIANFGAFGFSCK